MTTMAPLSSTAEEQRVEDPTDAGQSIGIISGLSDLAADGRNVATSAAMARLVAFRPAVRAIGFIP
jgi:hypothetical protein